MEQTFSKGTKGRVNLVHTLGSHVWKAMLCIWEVAGEGGAYIKLILTLFPLFHLGTPLFPSHLLIHPKNIYWAPFSAYTLKVVQKQLILCPFPQQIYSFFYFFFSLLSVLEHWKGQSWKNWLGKQHWHFTSWEYSLLSNLWNFGGLSRIQKDSTIEGTSDQAMRTKQAPIIKQSWESDISSPKEIKTGCGLNCVRQKDMLKSQLPVAIDVTSVFRDLIKLR